MSTTSQTSGFVFSDLSRIGAVCFVAADVLTSQDHLRASLPSGDRLLKSKLRRFKGQESLSGSQERALMTAVSNSVTAYCGGDPGITDQRCESCGSPQAGAYFLEVACQ